jgi:hypothetical protein
MFLHRLPCAVHHDLDNGVAEVGTITDTNIVDFVLANLASVADRRSR